jgi:hypothetical protein
MATIKQEVMDEVATTEPKENIESEAMEAVVKVETVVKTEPNNEEKSQMDTSDGPNIEKAEADAANGKPTTAINMLNVDITRLEIAPKVPTKPPITPAWSKQALKTSRDQNPVQVYCRIRPLDVPSDDSCVTVLSDTVVQVVPPMIDLKKTQSFDCVQILSSLQVLLKVQVSRYFSRLQKWND